MAAGQTSRGRAVLIFVTHQYGERTSNKLDVFFVRVGNLVPHSFSVKTSDSAWLLHQRAVRGTDGLGFCGVEGEHSFFSAATGVAESIHRDLRRSKAASGTGRTQVVFVFCLGVVGATLHLVVAVWLLTIYVTPPPPPEEFHEQWLACGGSGVARRLAASAERCTPR